MRINRSQTGWLECKFVTNPDLDLNITITPKQSLARLGIWRVDGATKIFTSYAV